MTRPRDTHQSFGSRALAANAERAKRSVKLSYHRRILDRVERKRVRCISASHIGMQNAGRRDVTLLSSIRQPFVALPLDASKRLYSE